MSPPSPRDSVERDPRWLAVVRRDAKVDGSFYVCISTSGTYCNPSCSTRRPLPEHVVFCSTTEEAEQAGFRPCKRCHPERSSRSHQRTAIVQHLCRALEAHDGNLPLADLAKLAGLSPSRTRRLFKSVVGLTPKQYGAAQRTSQVQAALSQSPISTQAAYRARLESPLSIDVTSSSSAVQIGGHETSIHYASAPSSLGIVLVAATPIGICSISLGEQHDALVHDLKRRFPAACWRNAPHDFHHTLQRVVETIESPRTGLDLPLDIQGTAFQQRVWRALQSIPAGKTASYTDIANALGVPNAARAVAQACAANPIAIAIPCHRVTRRDGKLSGYRWGIERKRELLKRERTMHHPNADL